MQAVSIAAGPLPRTMRCTAGFLRGASSAPPPLLLLQGACRTASVQSAVGCTLWLHLGDTTCSGGLANGQAPIGLWRTKK